MKSILNRKLIIIVSIVILNLLIFHFYFPRYKDKYPNLKGKHLTVYVALREEEAKGLLEKFKKETGCTYEYIKLPTEEAVKRILEERDNPKGDIFLGGTCDAYELLKINGALEKYKSLNSKDVPLEYKDSSNYWTGFQVDTLAIGINKEIWERDFASKGMTLPTEFNDLLKEEYNGKIILPNPYTSGTGYTFLATLYQELGQEKYKEFLQKLSNNIAAYTVSGFNSIQRVSSGEYVFTVNFLGDQLIEKDFNSNIISITPKNTGWNVDAVAKIKNDSNKEAAEAFIDFILSEDLANNLSAYSKAISTKKSTDIKDKIYQKYSFKGAALERTDIIKTFEDSK